MRFLKLSLIGVLVVLIPSISFAADSNTVVTDKTPPTASAPSIVINNSDVCKSTASAAIQTQILGFASGITVTDENCERLKLARSLYGMGRIPGNLPSELIVDFLNKLLSIKLNCL